jgi:hypothetical protein
MARHASGITFIMYASKSEIGKANKSIMIASKTVK